MGCRWPWLILAAQMAAATAATARTQLPSGRPVPARPGGFPRLATRTPGPDLASIAPARAFTRRTLQRWDLTGRCADITVVLSELLTNALCHAPPRPGGWPVRFGLLQDHPGSAVLCAVADPSPELPVPAPADHLAERGRGLLVVEELSDRWGYTAPSRSGKVVWATFATTGDLAADGTDPAFWWAPPRQPAACPC